MSRQTFEFSKAFIDKIGIGEFAKARNRNFLKSIFLYMVDWRTRKVVNLQRKMSEELLDIKETYYDNVDVLAKRLKHTGSINYLEDGYYDMIVWKIEEWVKKNIKYVRDIDRHNTPEYWQSSNETLTLKTADCEDGAWLIVILARLCGVPEDMIWLEAGDVFDPVICDKAVGHAYVKYICENDGVPRIIDWCYHPTKIKIGDRIFANENMRYLSTWFGVNDKRYFGRYKCNKEDVI